MAARILIIDDDRVNNALIKMALKDFKYDIVVAEDGDEGLAAVRVARPALIVLDVQMPRMSGYEFLSELKAIPGAAIPVIMMTSNNNMQDIFLSEGARAYLVKPVDPVKLAAKIQEVLGR